MNIQVQDAGIRDRTCPMCRGEVQHVVGLNVDITPSRPDPKYLESQGMCGKGRLEGTTSIPTIPATSVGQIICRLIICTVIGCNTICL